MISQDQIIEIAKLGGLTKDDHYEDGFGGSKLSRLVTGWRNNKGIFFRRLPDYLHSRDAIIPVICKQEVIIQQEVYRQLFRERFEKDTETTVRFTVSLEEIFHKTPSQLCEALLRATGKWKD